MMRLMLAFAFLLAPVIGKVTYGSIYSNETQFLLVEKFCFHPGGGELIMEWKEDARTRPGQKWLFFHDLDDGFPAIYNTGNSCPYKANLAVQEVLTSTSNAKFVVQGIRPRWWYIVLANCDNEEIPQQLSLEYFHLTLVNEGGKFQRHFSVDEEGVFETLIFGLLVIMILGALFVFSYRKTRNDKETRVEQVHALMIFVCAVEFLSICLQMSHRSGYADDGIGHPGLVDFVVFLNLIPEMLVVGLIIFISKGYQISAMRIDESSLRSVVEVMVVYFGACIAVSTWSFKQTDVVLMLTIYQTPPGTILTILRVVIFLWFLSNLNSTWRNERNTNKKAFYLGFMFFGSFALLTVPAMAIATNILETWQRKRAVEITQIVTRLIIYFGIWYMFGKEAKYIKRSADQSGGGNLAKHDSFETVDTDDIRANADAVEMAHTGVNGDSPSHSDESDDSDN